MKRTFFKTICNYKSANNKNTTGLAYDEKMLLVSNSIKNGETKIGINAVIDNGIASVTQKKIIVSSICKTICELESRLSSKPKKFGKKPRIIPIKKI